MTIKITSCSVPGIWYARRIGDEFTAVKKGSEFWVNSIPILKVHAIDAEVKTSIIVPPAKRIYHTIIELLKERDMAYDELFEKYRSIKRSSSFHSMKNIVLYLTKKKIVEYTGKKKRSNNLQLCKVWRLSENKKHEA